MSGMQQTDQSHVRALARCLASRSLAVSGANRQPHTSFKRHEEVSLSFQLRMIVRMNSKELCSTAQPTSHTSTVLTRDLSTRHTDDTNIVPDLRDLTHGQLPLTCVEEVFPCSRSISTIGKFTPVEDRTIKERCQ